MNLRPLLTLIPLCIAFGGAVARGGDNFGQSWPKITQSLTERGIKSIGDFDIEAFIEKAKTINWAAMPASAPSVITGARRSAYYLRNEHRVYVSAQLPAEALSSLPSLELHEALGALGYDDRNYSLSTAMTLLSKTTSAPRLETLRRNYGAGLFRTANMTFRVDGEGGSSVGGGGDLSTLFIKNQVLDRISTREPTWDFLTTYPRIAFEPMYRGNGEEIVLAYKFRGPNVIRDQGPLSGVLITNGFQEQISVWVPMKRWNRSAAERQTMLKEIQGKITGILPISTAHESVTDSARCSRRIEVEFPATTDWNVRAIQRDRAGFIRGCHELADYASEIITPSIPENERPARPGLIGFDCIYHYQNREHPYIINVTEGRSGMFSSSSGVTEGDWLMGAMTVDREGKIVSMAIFYKDPAGVRSEKKSPAQNPEKARVTMDIGGHPLTYECTRRE